MKYCNMCGTKNEDGFQFCFACGERLVVVQSDNEDTEKEPEMIVVDTAPEIKDSFVGETSWDRPAPEEIPSEISYPWEDEQVYVASPVYEEPASANETFGYNDEVSERNRRSRGMNFKPFIVAGAAALAVLSVVVIGALTNWFGFVHPMGKLLQAAINTASAESATLKFGVISQDADYAAEVPVDCSFRYNVDYDEEELAFVYSTVYEDYESVSCLYKNSMYTYYKYDGSDCFGSEYDVEDTVEDFFDDFSEFGEDGEINWKKLLREAGLEDYVDHREIEPFLKEFYKDCLTDDKWLRDKLGYKKSGNTYVFEPDFEELVDELVDILIDSDLLEREARDVLRDNREHWELNRDLALEIKIKLSGKYISYVEVAYEYDDITYDFSVTVSKINRTKIAETELKEIKRDARDAMEDVYCDECGIELEYFYNMLYHGDCEMCGSHGYIGYGKENNMCYYCYDKYRYYYD